MKVVELFLNSGSVLRAPASPRIQRNTYIALAAIVVLLAIIEVTCLGAPIFPVDDAYITLHNAMVLRGAPDANYVGIPALVGATSAAHVVLVAFFLLVLPPVWAMWTTLWLGVLAYATGIARLAFVHGASLLETTLLVLAAALLAHTPHQMLNGLETGLTMGALAWTMASASDPVPKRPWIFPVLLGVLPFLRPELVAFSGLLALAWGWDQWTKRSDARITAQRLARTAGIALAAMLPWLVLYYASTGHAYPTTVSAKKYFFAEGCFPAELKEKWTSEQIDRFTEILGYFSRALLLLLATRLGWAAFAFVLALVGAYYAQLPGALGHYEQRYLYVTVPLLFYGVASTLRHRWPLVRYAALGLTVVCIDQSAFAFRRHFQDHLNTRNFTVGEVMSAAEWAKANLPPDSRLLIHDAGYIAYDTSFVMYDLVGLKTPSSIPFHRDLTWATCGARRGDAVNEIALRDRPTHLIVIRGWDHVYKISESLRLHGWGLEQLRDRPDGYDVYRLTPPAQ